VPKKTNQISKKQIDILDAAVQAFQELGYDNASMDYIAKIANASKRTVYNHFPSKEALFMAVMNRFMEEASQLKQITYSSDRTIEDQLSEFAEAKLAVANNPSWLGLMKVSAGVFISHPDLSAQIMARAEDLEDTLAIWLQSATEDGRLVVKNPKLAADVFWSMVGGAFFWPSIFMGTMKTEEAKLMKEELIQTFLARYQK
jgi:TetR/AcrR family transcriptional regulator, regulator of autoinduction and epiphytic fitness